MNPLWYGTKDGDRSCIELYERHYSCYEYADGRDRTQCVGPGQHIMLRTADADAMFVWRKYIDDTIPKQEGVECSVFRNEAPHRYQSSELIRQADAIADRCWPRERHYTKVRPSAVRSANPGCCFIKAGWRRCGMTKGGLLILDRFPEPMVAHPFDACYCGDYRHQHVNGTGRCKLGSLCTPSPCQRFRFVSGPSEADVKKAADRAYAESNG